MALKQRLKRIEELYLKRTAQEQVTIAERVRKLIKAPESLTGEERQDLERWFSKFQGRLSPATLDGLRAEGVTFADLVLALGRLKSGSPSPMGG